MEIGIGSASESTALEQSLIGLTQEDFGRLRVSSSVPGRPGPHVSATQLIEVVTKTSQSNASQTWNKLKVEDFFSIIGTSGINPVIYRFPGQRGGSPSEVVDIPTALQIIMVLPGRTAAKVRLGASVLMVRFLAGDLSLVGEIYGMNQLQDYLKEEEPPLCAFKDALDAGQVTSATLDPFETPPKEVLEQFWATAIGEKAKTLQVQEQSRRATIEAEEEAKAKRIEADEEAKAKRFAVEEAAKSQVSKAEAQTLIVEEKAKAALIKAEYAAKQATVSNTSKQETSKAKAAVAEANERESAARSRIAESYPSTKRQRTLPAPVSVPSDPNPDFVSYRAAGIRDDAIPKDAAQADLWYKKAMRIQIQNRPPDWNNNATKLYDFGARTIHGEAVPRDMCCPPRRSP